ncbi:MAG: hypothetical protein KF897_06940 [Opitutaceae bacterium]|nr:hypothetical protein [Opitutaceae bacterium]
MNTTSSIPAVATPAPAATPSNVPAPAAAVPSRPQPAKTGKGRFGRKSAGSPAPAPVPAAKP